MLEPMKLHGLTVLLEKSTLVLEILDLSLKEVLFRESDTVLDLCGSHFVLDFGQSNRLLLVSKDTESLQSVLLHLMQDDSFVFQSHVSSHDLNEDLNPVLIILHSKVVAENRLGHLNQVLLVFQHEALVRHGHLELGFDLDRDDVNQILVLRVINIYSFDAT